MKPGGRATGYTISLLRRRRDFSAISVQFQSNFSIIYKTTATYRSLLAFRYPQSRTHRHTPALGCATQHCSGTAVVCAAAGALGHLRTPRRPHRKPAPHRSSQHPTPTCLLCALNKQCCAPAQDAAESQLQCIVQPSYAQVLAVEK